MEVVSVSSLPLAVRRMSRVWTVQEYTPPIILVRLRIAQPRAEQVMFGSRDQIPLIGREHQLAPLRSHLDAARRGGSGVVLVGGEPGVGKTRLMAELGGRAHAGGWS